MFAKYTNESTAKATRSEPPSHSQQLIDFPGTFKVRMCYIQILIDITRTYDARAMFVATYFTEWIIELYDITRLVFIYLVSGYRQQRSIMIPTAMYSRNTSIRNDRIYEHKLH